MKTAAVVLGVVGVSLSAVFVRWSTAPPLALAFYRLAFASALLAPAVFFRCREELRTLGRREAALCCVGGVFLSLHFIAYFFSLQYTSIASSVVLIDTEVFFVALATVFLFHRRLPRRAWLAILLTFCGSALVALSDTASAGSHALLGDALALAGALCMAVYTMIGTVCRKKLSTTVYTFFVYLSASCAVLVMALASGTPVTGWPARDLLLGLCLAVFCTLLGHSLFSWSLRYLPAPYVSTVKLLEPVIAALWGLLLFAERPGPRVIVGGAIILLGVGMYARAPETAVPDARSTLPDASERTDV
jgi:drug/metabolite transporter (DMT)-like permease